MLCSSARVAFSGKSFLAFARSSCMSGNSHPQLVSTVQVLRDAVPRGLGVFCGKLCLAFALRLGPCGKLCLAFPCCVLREVVPRGHGAACHRSNVHSSSTARVLREVVPRGPGVSCGKLSLAVTLRLGPCGRLFLAFPCCVLREVLPRVHSAACLSAIN